MTRLSGRSKESFASSVVIGIILVVVGLIIMDLQLPSISTDIMKMVGVISIGLGIFSIVKKFF